MRTQGWSKEELKVGDAIIEREPLDEAEQRSVLDAVSQIFTMIATPMAIEWQLEVCSIELRLQRKSKIPKSAVSMTAKFKTVEEGSVQDLYKALKSKEEITSSITNSVLQTKPWCTDNPLVVKEVTKSMNGTDMCGRRSDGPAHFEMDDYGTTWKEVAVDDKKKPPSLVKPLSMRRKLRTRKSIGPEGSS